MAEKKSNPIIETSLELSVLFNVPSDAIVGILYNSLRQVNDGVKLHKLPVANIPDEIRKMDTNLKDKPTHQLVCTGGFVQIGENILCIGGRMPYISWGVFKEFIEQIIRLLHDNKLIGNIKNIKLRYLNFFKDNIFENINLMISMQGVDRLCSGSTVFRTEIPCNNEMLGVLQITNGVHVSNKSLGLDNNGSLIDIIIIKKHVSLPISSDTIDAMHQEVEDLFINLTRKD